MTSDVGDRFAHRLAVMLECALLSPERSWDAAHELLDEYRQALHGREGSMGLLHVED